MEHNGETTCELQRSDAFVQLRPRTWAMVIAVTTGAGSRKRPGALEELAAVDDGLVSMYAYYSPIVSSAIWC